MTLTAEQRRDKNRENARKSTGPKTKEGKERSRANSTTHGLTATTLAMPNEDPSEIAARSSTWNDFYKPESPGAHHLVNVCVRSTLLSDRLARYHDSTIADQVREAEETWLRDRQEEVEHLKTLMNDDPPTAVRLLGQTAMGLDYLASRWKAMIDVFVSRGFWFDEERFEVVRLCGYKIDENCLKTNPEAFKICYFNALCHGEDPLETARAYCNDERLFPESLRNIFLPDVPAERSKCVEWMSRMLKYKFETLKANSKLIQETRDGPDFAGALDRALILKDEQAARLFLRYSAESRNSFHKAYGTLLKTLEADKKAAEIDDEDDYRNEATEWELSAVEGSGVESRNEATAAYKALSDQEMERDEDDPESPSEGESVGDESAESKRARREAFLHSLQYPTGLEYPQRSQ
jgi:hypothetical protein